MKKLNDIIEHRPFRLGIESGCIIEQHNFKPLNKISFFSFHSERNIGSCDTFCVAIFRVKLKTIKP